MSLSMQNIYYKNLSRLQSSPQKLQNVNANSFESPVLRCLGFYFQFDSYKNPVS